MKAPEPPRALERLVAAVAACSAHRDSIVGDLHEGFARRALQSPRSARSWYRRQTVSILMRYLPELLGYVWRSLRAEHGDPPMTALLDTVRHAARQLGRRPGVTAILVSTLALGIGANAAIFSVVRGVLLKPLPYPDPARIVTIWSTNVASGTTRGDVSRQDADDWAAARRSLDVVGTYTTIEGNARLGGMSERVRVALVTSGMFRALGVAPFLGRPLIASDDSTLHSDVAVVSHALWAGALGGDPTMIGRAITLDGEPLVVVGVMPPSFDFPTAKTAIWKPFGAPPDATGGRDAHWVRAVARLRTGVTLRTAESDLATIAARLARDFPATNRDVGVHVEPLLQAETGDVRPLLLVAWGMVALVLMIVATNVANLQLARASEREGEIAVRAALGAARGTIARQFLAESVLLGVVAGALGCGLAALALPLMRGIRGLALPRLESLGIDGWVLLYSIGISIAIGIAFGVAPALGAARTQPALALRRAGRGTVAPVRERVRAALIVAQVALAAVVVVVAGLLFRSFERLSQVDPGFALEHGVTFRVAPDWGTYPKREQARVLFDELLTTLRAMPGSVAVGAVNRLPLTGGWWTTQYEIEGKPAPLGREPTLLYRVATRDYFTAMGMSLLGGRGLSTSDERDAQRTVVVCRALAERAWPGEGAIGRRIRFDSDERAPWYTVVGVVSDVRGSGLADDATPTAYVALAQATFGHFGDWGMDVVVRTNVDGPNVIAGARRALATIAPAVPLFDARPLSDLVASDLARRRSLVLLLGAFAATAMTLAGLGLYGVVAYGVAQRRGELGVRMALGAGRATVWRSVVARSLGLAGIGVALGLPVAAAATRSITGLLYGVTPLDAWTFVGVGTALLLVAGAAAWVPAFRASRVSPAEALRRE